MTFVATVNGRESIWCVADRRLSRSGRIYRDDARKLLSLQTRDAVAIIGYAGLGATPRGTEPADWMSAVLRGRNVLLEQALEILAGAAKRELPKHLIKVRGNGDPAHLIIATALVGSDVRNYSIITQVSRKQRKAQIKFNRINNKIGRPLRACLGGSGAPRLLKDDTWLRPILRLIDAYEKGKIPPKLVALELAKLNSEVSARTLDNSVGPNSIVAWSNSKVGNLKGGGGHEFFIGSKPADQKSVIPTIVNGSDVSALIGVIAPMAFENLRALMDGNSEQKLDVSAINSELAKLPEGPDENLL